MKLRPTPKMILPNVFCDGLCGGLVAPAWPVIVEELVGADAAGASITFGMLTATYFATMFICAPFFGRLSDRFGRRPLMLALTACTVIDYLVCGAATTLWVLFAARVMAGVFGANVGAIFAYVADSSTPAERGTYFAHIGAALGLGAIIGPALGGLLGHSDPRLPLWVAALLQGCSLIYICVVVPESMPAQQRRPLDLRGVGPLASLQMLRGLRVVRAVFLALFLYNLALAMRQAVTLLFLQLRLHWDTRQIGLWLGVGAIVSVLSQAGLTRMVVKRLGEQRTAVIGLSMSALGTFLFALVGESWQVYALLIFTVFAVMTGPIIHGLASRHAPSDQQGQFQGALASVLSIPGIVGPIFGTVLLSSFSDTAARFQFPGAPFVAAGALIAIALFLLLRLFRVEAAATLPSGVETAKSV